MAPFDRWFRTDDQIRRDIEDEIDAHLEARVRQLIANGAHPDDAEREARRRFGDVSGSRRTLATQARRIRRALRMRDAVDQLAQDVRYVGRTLARHPAFTLGVVATLALGLGVNAAIFRVADRVLRRPPEGVARPFGLVRVEGVRQADGGPQRQPAFSYPEASRMLDSGAFETAALYTMPALPRNPDAPRIAVSYVDANYFPVLGAQVAGGRTFDVYEAEPDARAGVAIVSIDRWMRITGSRTFTPGVFIEVNGRQHAIIGVARRQFTGIDLEPADVWLPFGDADLGRGSINGVEIPWHRTDMLRAIRIVGRPRGTVTEAAGRLEAALAVADRENRRPLRSAALHPIVPMGDPVRAREVDTLLRRLTWIAAVIFLIAVANAVNLLLARGLERAREIGIRVAIGASRARVTRLLLMESLVLAMLSAAAALVCSYWFAIAMQRLLFPESRWMLAALDARTILFTAALTLLTGLTAGGVTARQSARHAVRHGLREGRSASPRAARTRSVVMIAQSALSLSLVAGCALLVMSLIRLNAVRIGFEPQDLVMITAARTAVTSEDYERAAAQVHGRGLARSWALASVAPFGATAVADITVPGSSFVPASNRDLPLFSAVSASYFRTLGTRVLEGRGFLTTDVAGAEPVAIVNRAMVRRYWPAGDPFDSCIIARASPCARIVGIVEDVTDAPAADAPMRFYLSLEQTGDVPAALLIRAAEGLAHTARAAARDALARPGAAPPFAEIVSERVRRALRPWRMAAVLFGAMGALAVILACVGVYSLLSCVVSERRHEIGVRMALGASRGDVLRLIVGHGLKLVLAGGAVGAAGGVALGHVLEALLFNVSPLSLPAHLLAAGGFTLATLAAMLPPALRATGVPPVGALRAE